MTYELGELEQIIRPDGAVYNLGDGSTRAVLLIGGRGAPAVQYLTARGFMQQSETVTGWLIQPRTLSAQIQWTDLDRDDYWLARRELMAFMRPNWGGDFTLLHTRSDGAQRAIKVRPDSTPVHEDDITNWPNMAVALSWIAHDPTFYDPTAHMVTFLAAGLRELYFPLLFDVPSVNYVQYGDMGLGASFYWTAVNGSFTATAGTGRLTPSSLPCSVYQANAELALRPGESVSVSIDLGNTSPDDKTVEVELGDSLGNVEHTETYVVTAGSGLITHTFSFDVEDAHADFRITVRIIADAGLMAYLAIDNVEVTITALPTAGGIAFGDDSLIGEAQSITYTGEWATYPTIVITGPYTSLTLRNTTTGKAIKLGHPVAAGQTRTLTLTPGSPTVVDQAGVSKFSELVLPDTDLGGFNIRPAGIPANDNPYEGVTDGINVIQVEGEGFSEGVTQVVMTYYDRFVSVA